jgi:NAD(P)-dependent dehydrogenase (short-subunit alcohol dehydrogenase family)
MAGKVLFITGAGSGMGQMAAKRALAAGWSVAALDVDRAGLDLLGDSAQLLKIVVDVAVSPAVQRAVEQTEEQLGPIDRVTNAAAIMPLGLLAEQRLEVIHKIMAINYGGLVNVTKAALPRMLARRRGEFVSFSSMAGLWPILYFGGYSAAKHAVVAFTEVLYHENRDSGVRFACVCPPTVATPLLKQAKDTVWPKILDVFPPISPESVLDEIERSLTHGRFWVFPGPLSALVWRVRRWVPGLLWWRVHKVEGR